MGILLDDNAAPRQSRAEQIRDLFIPELFTRGKKASTRLGTTAWLDGLRGCAALCVTFMHLTVFTHDGIELCYGSKFRHNDEYNTTFAALPIIRLPFTGGHFSVMLFFVISGYVVPRRLIQHLHNGSRRQDFFDDVQSAMVRRPIRLYLPVILSTLAIAFCWHIFNLKPESLPKQSNIFREIFAWVLETSLFSYFWRFGWLFSYYNVHTWTIPIELRGSMFMFVYLIIVSGLSTKGRIYMTLAMTIHLGVLSPGAWFACFFAGMFLCEIDLVSSNDSTIKFAWSGVGDWLHAKQREGIRLLTMNVLLIVSLYLATQPSSDWSTKAETLGTCPGWKTLSALIPFHYIDADSQFRWYWLFWAAALMVFVIRELQWLRSVFETPFAQYLGRHSFALYLIHGPMIQYFADNIFYMTGVKQAWTEQQVAEKSWLQNVLCDQPWWPLPKGGPAGLEPNFLFSVLLCLPFFLYVAEIGTKLFDNPSIKASKYIWQKWRAF